MTRRRQFLVRGGGSLAAALLAACGSEGPQSAAALLQLAERNNEKLERLLFRHTSMNEGSPGRALAGSEFPSYFVADSVPVWDEATRGAWTLEVGGAVKRPLRLTLPELTGLKGRTQRVDHFCVEGWTAVAERTGVPLRELAAMVEPAPEAAYVDFVSFDTRVHENGDLEPYHECWDIESAMHPQTLIAYAQDGKLLDPAYGAPARVHSPVKLGYKNTKYLTKILFMPARSGGYWTDRGYEWFGGT